MCSRVCFAKSFRARTRRTRCAEHEGFPKSIIIINYYNLYCDGDRISELLIERARACHGIRRGAGGRGTDEIQRCVVLRSKRKIRYHFIDTYVICLFDFVSIYFTCSIVRVCSELKFFPKQSCPLFNLIVLK